MVQVQLGAFNSTQHYSHLKPYLRTLNPDPPPKKKKEQAPKLPNPKPQNLSTSLQVECKAKSKAPGLSMCLPQNLKTLSPTH